MLLPQMNPSLKNIPELGVGRAGELKGGILGRGGGLKETKNFDDQLWDSVEGRVDTKKWSLN